MTRTPPKPEVTQAIIKGAVCEAVLLAVGMAIYVATGYLAAIIVAAVLGSGVLLLLMLQAGAFGARNE